jgi:predicted enzyme related to lactoylglutathione lyase
MSDKNRDSPWIVSIPIVVSDKEASKKWYTEKLGFVVKANDGHWVTVGGREKGSEFHLCQGSENTPKPIPLEPGPSGIVIAVPGDFQSECRRLMERGVEFSHPPEQAPWGWYATIRDPDGNEHYLAPAL